MTYSLHHAAHAALMAQELEHKLARVARLADDLREGRLHAEHADWPIDDITVPGRPAKPVLLSPLDMPRRRLGTPEGRAALIHAVTHIEFNAINLALDCVYRFRGLPMDFYTGWAQVAFEESTHFQLLRDHLRQLGFEYGDFPAHNGLWEMALKTAHDPLVRMALVPRVLEARGLDATPVMMEKLRGAGDAAGVAILEIILRDEISHVALGDRWFRTLCNERALDAEATFAQLLVEFDAPHAVRPINVAARLAAGFCASELEHLP